MACFTTAETPTVSDYKNEPYIYEKVSSEATFNADGTGNAVTLARARIINESGVQRLGQILFPYSQGQETLSIDFARVHKPDGTVLEISTDSVVDQPAPFAAFFPVYSDVRVLHLLAPSLRPGDILEYQATREIHSPPAPGHFFFEHKFENQVVVLNESLTIRVPAELEIQLRHSEDSEPSDLVENDMRVLVWQTANLEIEAPSLEIDLSELISIPDIEISSFDSWATVGNWYRGLAKGRAAADEAISVKARSLTEGLDSDLDRIRAIYNFVAREFRYLGLELGMGAYQPSLASDVLRNRYGDCKDKHTLLQSLLGAIGIEATPVLVSSLRQLSPAVPSPQQFDHMITSVSLPNDRTLFLDSTIQVAPFQYLAPNIRGKTGLLIPADQSAELVEISTETAFDTFIDVQVTGDINDAGRFSGEATHSYHGDEEFMLRSMLFSLPTAQWHELAEGAHDYLTNLGEISDANFSGATETDGPLILTYSLSHDDYIDSREEQQHLLPMLPRMIPPEIPEMSEGEETAPMETGLPNRQTSRLSIRLSPRFVVTAPDSIQLEEDFGEYRSSFQLDGDRLAAERSLILHSSKVAPDSFEQYEEFRKAIEKDHKKSFTLELTAQAMADQVASGDVQALYSRAENAVDDKAWHKAVPLLQQVVELEPNHPSAWQDLGRALGNTGDYEAGIEAIRKQLEINPDHGNARNNLGWALWEVGDLEGAEAAFRAQLERFPVNRYANSSLGKILAGQDRCTEAIPFLQQSVALERGHNWNRYRLGRCLLMVERTDEGVERLEELVDATENTNLLLKAGRAAEEHEQYETAIALFEQVVLLDPDDPSAYHRLGFALRESGRPAEAIVVLQEYLELSPDDSDMRKYLTLLMSKQGDYSGAQELVTSGGEVDSETLSILILSLARSGETEEALEKARLHLEDNPEDLEVLDALGTVQLSTRRVQEACETYQKLIGIDPDFPGAQGSLAQGYILAMRFDLAQPHAEKALEQDPTNWQALGTMSVLEARVGNLEAAILHLEQALAYAPESLKAGIREQIEVLKSQFNK